MVEFVNEKFHLPGWRAMSSTYDANNSGWYEAYMELEKILGSLDNTLSAFGGAGFCPISENVDRLFDGFAALSFCRDNLEYELFVEIDEKLMKQFGEMTDEFATLDVRNIRTPNVLGIRGINVGYDAEGRAVSETVGGEVKYLTLENFTGAAGFDRTPGYKEQCITGFSKMLENQYNFYVDEGVLDRNVKLWEYLDGMMPREFEYSQYTEVWKKTVHSFLDVLVVPTMIEAVTGVEFITGDHLTDNEQAGKAVQSLIQAVSIGMTAGGAYSKGITYVTAGKMQSSQISKYAACKVMKSVAEDGVMNMVTTELTEHDCELAARVLMFASMYVGMQEAPDFVDRYVEDGGLVKSSKGSVILNVGDINGKADVGDMGVVKSRGDSGPTIVSKLTSIDVKATIEKNGISVDEFSKLLNPKRTLTPDELKFVDKIRADVGLPETGIVMSKIIPQSDIYNYLYNENYSSVRGFVSVEEHSRSLSTLEEVFEGNRLDYNNTAFKIGSGVDGISHSVGSADIVYGKITYVLEDTDSVKVPTDFPTAENIPYTGRGFTGSKNIVLPELIQDNRAFVDGDILGIYNSKTGTLIQQFVYDSDAGWLLK